jgi:serine/threonine-protein kinase RIM15
VSFRAFHYRPKRKKKMADNNGRSKPHFLVPPAVTALKAEARESGPQILQMERSVSGDIRAEREDLREAAEQTLNVILELDLDGRIKWVSPSWKQVVGSSTEKVEGQSISDLLVSSNKNVFHDAARSMQEDDSRSRFVRFSLRMGPKSVLKVVGDNAAEKPEEGGEEIMTDVLDMEAQGIMVYDRSGGGESHVSEASINEF